MLRFVTSKFGCRGQGNMLQMRASFSFTNAKPFGFGAVIRPNALTSIRLPAAAYKMPTMMFSTNDANKPSSYASENASDGISGGNSDSTMDNATGTKEKYNPSMQSSDGNLQSSPLGDTSGVNEIMAQHGTCYSKDSTKSESRNNCTGKVNVSSPSPAPPPKSSIGKETAAPGFNIPGGQRFPQEKIQQPLQPSEPQLQLPTKEQVEKYFFRVVAFVYDLSYLTIMWTMKAVDLHIVKNEAVQKYWQKFHEKMEKAKKD